MLEGRKGRTDGAPTTARGCGGGISTASISTSLDLVPASEVVVIVCAEEGRGGRCDGALVFY